MSLNLLFMNAQYVKLLGELANTDETWKEMIVSSLPWFVWNCTLEGADCLQNE